jgi:hypothetical protein
MEMEMEMEMAFGHTLVANVSRITT